jgi:hypothetical protein
MAPVLPNTNARKFSDFLLECDSVVEEEDDKEEEEDELLASFLLSKRVLVSEDI